MAKGLKEPIEEDLGFTLFVAGDVLLTPCGELGEFFPARHGGVLHEDAWRGNLEFTRTAAGVFAIAPGGSAP